MKSKDSLKKAGDILYRVDPRRLSVKMFRIGRPDDEYNYATTTYENFSIKCDNEPLKIPEKLPVEYQGHLYFQNEDEANSYIKTQIGM